MTISNCVIEALKRKFSNWDEIKLIPIWHNIWHFHVMWLDRRNGMVYHFTHKSIPGWHCDLLFKGRVEEVNPDNLKKWLKNNKAIAPKI